jgi:uncharacterized protein (DUF58 family)
MASPPALLPDDLRLTTNLELLARQLVEGFITGLHKSPYHGFSVEFAEHRLYNEGESTRYIDWRVFARTDRLYTKQFEEETNLRCLIALDVSPSMYYPAGSLAKIKFSIIAAAALVQLLHRQRDAAGLCLFSESIHLLTAVKSTLAHRQKLLSELQQLLHQPYPSARTRVAAVLHEVAEKIHRRSLIILFSDMFDAENTEELFKALQHLRHNRHEVIVFHVADYFTELEFNFPDRPTEFIDLEQRQKIKLNPADVREHFRKEAREFFRQISLRCSEFKIDFVPCNVREDVKTILQAFLIKRARMG